MSDLITRLRTLEAEVKPTIEPPYCPWNTSYYSVWSCAKDAADTLELVRQTLWYMAKSQPDDRGFSVLAEKVLKEMDPPTHDQ